MGKRVLLADDSATIQKLVKMALAGTSYELHSAFDGREALKLIDKATPDIVLADAIMPDMDGYQLSRAVKDDPRLVGVPVVLLIGRFQPYDDERAQAAGIDDRMIKPFSADQLIGLIEKLLAESEARRPAIEEDLDGDMDATVNMTPEELAAHTSHWQQAQTAMTEDIPKIEDIEFDEDVAFDDPVTTDMREADTMMLDDALGDPLESGADVGGPMTMELSTEDLADIDDPVADMDDVSAGLDITDEILGGDDDLVELDESDLLDDSHADFDTELAGQIMTDPVAIEDQDTGPLQEIATPLPTPNFDAPAAFDLPKPLPLPDISVPEIEDPADSLLADDIPAVPSGQVSFPEDVDLSDSAVLPEADHDPLSEDRTTMPNMLMGEANQVKEDDGLDQTVAVSPEWIAANVGGSTEPLDTPAEPDLVETSPVAEVSFEPEVDPVSTPVTEPEADLEPEPEFETAPNLEMAEPTSEEEPPLEVDEMLPLEETTLEQDTLLDDADFEPLSSAIEEPLEDTLLANDELTDVASDEEALVAEAVPEEAEEISRYDMPTQEVPPPDFDDEDALLEGDTVAADEAYLEAETVNAEEAFLQVDPISATEIDDAPLEPDFAEEVGLEDDGDPKDALAESLEDEEAPVPESTVDMTQNISFDEPETPVVDAAALVVPAVAAPVVAAAAVAAATDAQDDASQADIGALSENQLNKLADMVAERVMRKFERDTIREIAWEVIPELSEAMIKKRIFELEREADQA